MVLTGWFVSFTIILGLFDDIPDRQTSMVYVSSSTQLIKLNFGANTPLSQINPHLTNICHFLQARGYWANAIGKQFSAKKVTFVHDQL